MRKCQLVIYFQASLGDGFTRGDGKKKEIVVIIVFMKKEIVFMGGLMDACALKVKRSKAKSFLLDPARIVFLNDS